VQRGLYRLAIDSTNYFEEARSAIASFLGAKSSTEIIFNSGATAGLNQLAMGLEDQFGSGDVILISELEHHANFLPWQRLAKRTGAQLRLVPVLENGEFDITCYEEILKSGGVKLVSLSLVSHVLGNILPLKEMFSLARNYGVTTTVCDATQAISRAKIDVLDLGCDALVFSGHKAFAPSGIGVLYCRKETAQCMSPAFVGGGMVEQVTPTEMWLREIPSRFEAGTPAIEAAIALKTAIEFIENLDLPKNHQIEVSLIDHIATELNKRGDCKLLGWAQQGGGLAPAHAGILSFTVNDVHAHDVAQLLADHGVAVRAGFHCAQPLMTRLQLQGTIRVSLAPYNSREDGELLLQSLSRLDQLRRTL